MARILRVRLNAPSAAIVAIMIVALGVSVATYLVVSRSFESYKATEAMVGYSNNLQLDLVAEQSAIHAYSLDPRTEMFSAYRAADDEFDADLASLTAMLHVSGLDGKLDLIAVLQHLNDQLDLAMTRYLRHPVATSPDLAQVRDLNDKMRAQLNTIINTSHSEQTVILGRVRFTILAGTLILLGMIALLGTLGIGQEIRRISTLAFHDALTGLQNRASFTLTFQQAIARAKRDKHPAACMFIDLDGFKTVNDTLGHQAGDYVLQVVAQTLRDSVRGSDIVGRLGGDEFVIALSWINKAEDVALVAEKILRSVAQPIDFEGKLARVSASIGVSLFPEDADDADTLLQLADKAMYVAKHRGKNQVAAVGPAFEGSAAQA
jgi:diguanylate cyclase (GGDEF)-like protein